MSDILSRVAALRLIPIIAIDQVEHAAPLGEALVAGGLPIVEITLRTPPAVEAVRTLAGRGDMLVGAGTILTADQADAAIDAGAQFLVSPGTNPAVVEHALQQDVIIVPGVVTPSEIELAMSLGVQTLKFFPAEMMGGVAMLKALAGPYPDIRFIPTGGITPELLPSYLRLSSVIACGGSWLAPRELLAAGRFDAIARLIEQATKLLAAPPDVAT